MIKLFSVKVRRSFVRCPAAPNRPAALLTGAAVSHRRSRRRRPLRPTALARP